MKADNDNCPEGKTCSRCGEYKELSKFHSQPSGKFGRHSYCAACACEKQRETRKRNYSPEQKRKWLLSGRYGISPEQYEQMLYEQSGNCAICGTHPARPCVDHSHYTGRTRGILCHRCNVGLPYVEDAAFRARALVYLARYESVAA